MCMHCCNYLNNNNGKKDVMAALLSTQSKKTKPKKREKEKRNGFGGLHFSISSHPEKVRIEDANTTYKMT